MPDWLAYHLGIRLGPLLWLGYVLLLVYDPRRRRWQRERAELDRRLMECESRWQRRNAASSGADPPTPPVPPRSVDWRLHNFVREGPCEAQGPDDPRLHRHKPPPEPPPAHLWGPRGWGG